MSFSVLNTRWLCHSSNESHHCKCFLPTIGNHDFHHWFSVMLLLNHRWSWFSSLISWLPTPSRDYWLAEVKLKRVSDFGKYLSPQDKNAHNPLICFLQWENSLLKAYVETIPWQLAGCPIASSLHMWLSQRLWVVSFVWILLMYELDLTYVIEPKIVSRLICLNSIDVWIGFDICDWDKDCEWALNAGKFKVTLHYSLAPFINEQDW